MAKYHPIGFNKIDPSRLLNLSNKEVELIKMIRKVEGDEYPVVMKKAWSYYLNEMEKFKIDTSFVKTK